MYCHTHHCHYHHCNCVPKDSKETGRALTQEELLALTQEMKEELKDYTVDLKDQIFSYIDIGVNPVEIANTFASLKEQDTYILRTLTNKIDELNNTTNLSMYNLRTRVTDLEGQSATLISDLTELENNLSSLPFEGGILADTFVTMTANTDTIATNLRDFRSRRLDVIDYGMVAGEGVAPAVVAANTIALQKAVNSGKVLFPVNQVFEVSGEVIGEVDTYIEGNNSKLVFLKGYLYLHGNVSEAPNSLMSPLLAGSNKIHTDADFAEGDILNIVDTTFGSFSRHRSSYFAGQHFRVTRQDGAVTTVGGVADFNYLDTASNANVKIYKIKPIKAVINNLSVISSAELNSESGYTVRLRGCLGLEVSNVTGKGGDFACLVVERCVGGEITNTSGYQYGESDDGHEYGLSFSDSENINVFGGSYYGTRHGIAMGGSGFGGCNNIIVNGAEIDSDESATGSYSADFHGNVRNSYYKNCKILNGAVLSGYSNGYIGCDITSWSLAGGILLGEIVGGVFEIHGNKLRARVNPAWDSILKGNSSAVSELIDNDYTLHLKNNEIIGSSSVKTIVFATVNTANTKTVNPSVILEDNTYSNLGQLISVVEARKVGAVSTTAPNYKKIHVSGDMSGIPVTAQLLAHSDGVMTNTKHFAPAYTKKLSLTMTTGNSGAAITHTHPINYGRLLYAAHADMGTEFKNGTSALIPNLAYLAATNIRVGVNNSGEPANQVTMDVPITLTVGGTYVYS